MDTLRLTAERLAIKAAIKSLREKLGLPQQDMAARLGCRMSTYQKWEQGVSPPGGDWLIQIMQLCPDAESLAAFGLKFEMLNLKSAPPAPDPYEKVRADLDLILRDGASTVRNTVEEQLDKFADEIRMSGRKRKPKK